MLCDANQNCELWYRGQVQTGFQLMPSISRSIDGIQLNPELEIVFLSKFKSLATPYIDNLPTPPLPNGVESYWSWLFQMQHYGVPTRLLDWSRDALVALFFATNPEDHSLMPGIDSAVWVLNPVTLNKAYNFNEFTQAGYIPNVEEAGFNTLFGPDSLPLSNPKPAAAIGPLNSSRITAQRGVFTVFPHQKNLIPLEQFSDSSTFLIKICIATESAEEIFAQLQRYGINKIALFPELQSIAGEITRQVIAEKV
ncbi:MAG TPA: FRG domain-containing protein [Clostridiaceae bacterium]|nr:FRG domain-containing protein [Clostridiaceae bacterium]